MWCNCCATVTQKLSDNVGRQSLNSYTTVAQHYCRAVVRLQCNSCTTVTHLYRRAVAQLQPDCLAAALRHYAAMMSCNCSATILRLAQQLGDNVRVLHNIIVYYLEPTRPPPTALYLNFIKPSSDPQRPSLALLFCFLDLPQ